jgi:hypothetical protein
VEEGKKWAKEGGKTEIITGEEGNNGGSEVVERGKRVSAEYE